MNLSKKTTADFTNMQLKMRISKICDCSRIILSFIID